MYEKPTLEKFGTFRELTQIGFSGATDGFTIIGPPPGSSPASGCGLSPFIGGCAGQAGPTSS